MRNRHTPRHRGMAMMLVLIGLATATIVSVSYLASRDNSALIGENVSATAQARWSADAGLDLAIAALETEKDWRTGHSNGKLMNKFRLGEAQVTVLLTDSITGAPPTETTTDVEVKVTSIFDGVMQEVIAQVHVPLATPDTIDVDLSEFVVFVTEKLDMTDDTTITRWPMAPASKGGDELAVGVLALGMSSVELKGNSASIDTNIFTMPGASASLVLNESGPTLDEVALTDSIPFPASPTPPSVSSGGGRDDDDDGPYRLRVDNAAYDLSSDHLASELDVTNDAWLRLAGADRVLEVQGNAKVDHGGEIYVDGNATLVVHGDLYMNDGHIHLADNSSSLTIFVYKKMTVDDSYIGDDRPDPWTEDNSGYASYVDPERITIYSISGSSNTMEIKDNSVVKGTLYMPDWEVKVQDDSALYGRVATRKVTMDKFGAIFYDPALDSDDGYTTYDSKAFEADGTLRSAVKSLTSITDSALTTLADQLSLAVKRGEEIWYKDDSGTVEKLTLDSLLLLNEPDDREDGEPDPRTISVDVELESLGVDPRAWEARYVASQSE